MKTNLKIRILRHYNQLDQHQMAKKLDMNVAEYSRIETGLIPLKPEISDQMTAIFGLSLTDLDELPEILNVRLK